MPSSVVELPNGEELEFPEGVSEETQLRETSKYWMRHQIVENDQAGARAETVAKAADVAQQALDPREGLKQIGRDIATTGKGFAAAGEDVLSAIANLPGNLLAGRGAFENAPGKPEFGANFGAAAQGELTPAQIEDEAKSKAGDKAATIRLGLRDAAGSVPSVALGVGLTAAGVPAPLAFGGVLADQAYGETGDAKKALLAGATGALVPIAGAAGKAVAGAGLKSLVARGWMQADSTIAQKATEMIASQAGMQTVMEAAKTPEYLAANPEERKRMLMRSVAGNLAFALADAPGLAHGEPSATQAALAQDSMALVNAALRTAPLDRMSPDELAREAMNPEHGQVWADAARSMTTLGTPDDNVLQQLGDTKIVKRLSADIPPLERPEAANQAQEVFPERKLRVAGTYERPPDLADELEAGGHGKIRKLKPGETVDNEEAYRAAQKNFPNLFADDGFGPDDVASSVSRETGREVDPAAMIDQLAELKQTRGNDKEAFQKYTAAKKQEILFQEHAIEGKDRGGIALREVLPEEFSVGDKIKVRGEEGVVIKVKNRPDDETMAESATVKFGDKYGVRELPAGEAIKIDEGSWKRAAPGSEKLEDAFTGNTRTTEATNVPTSGELASKEAALLPRTVSSDVPAAGSDPISLAEIRQYLSKALDIPVRYRSTGGGGIRGKNLGLFRTKPETIRMKVINDIPTLAHEVGHYLHKITMGNSDFGGRFDAELMALGARTSRKTYTRDQVRKEGVAEFLAHWMADRAQALAKAPQFTQHFEQTLQGQYPEVWKIVTQAKGDLGRYIRQPAMMKLESRIDRTSAAAKIPAGQRVLELVDKTITSWVNQLHPLERAMKQARAFGLPDQEAKLVTDRAINFIGGWRGKVEYALEQRQIDLAGNDVGPSLHEILGPVEDLQEFSRYLVGRRELELLGRGIKTGMDPRDAMELRKELGGLDATYQPAAEKLYRFQEQQLHLLKQAGLLSGEQFLKIREVNKAYVPFFRVMEFLGGERSGGGGGGGFVNLGQGIHKLKGSDRRYIDPLESVVKNAYTLRELAERNAIGREFVQAIEKVEGGGRIAEQIAKRMTPADVKGEDVAAQLQKAGLDVEELGVDAKDLAFKIWRLAQQKDPKRGIFTVWREGKEEVWQLGDAQLYRALALNDTAGAKFLQDAFVKGLVVMPTRMLRAGATLTLEFIGRNPFRDQITAGVQSRYGFVPFWDGFRGVVSAIGKDQWYWDWVKSGGRYADFVAMDRADLQKKMGAIARDPTTAQTIQRLMNPLNVLNNLQRFSELMEQATRISEYRRAIQAGENPTAAANASKDVTVNFARAGEMGRVMNQLVAFFNAGVQDVSKVIRTHQERPLATTMKAIAFISVPSALAWWLAKDDKKLQGLPEWRKSFFWNVNVAELARRAGVDVSQGDFVLSFPKPFLLGQLYGSSIERGLDYAHQRDPNAVSKWFKDFLGSTPMTWDTAIPTAIRPLVETASNYSLFRRQPIENAGMQELPPELRYTPQSSLFARKLSAITPWLGLSPLKIDNLMRGYLGGLAKYGTDAVDWIMTRAEVMDIPPAPAKDMWERPFFRGFKGSPYEASEYVERFYKGLAEARQRVAGAKRLVKDGDPAGARNFVKNVGEDLSFYTAGGGERMTALTKGEKAMSEIAQSTRIVQNSRNMTPADKRQKLTELSRLRDRTAEALFKGLISPEDQAKVY